MTVFDHKVKCTGLLAESLCFAKAACQIERSESQAPEFLGRCIGDSGNMDPQCDRHGYWTLPVWGFIVKRRAGWKRHEQLMFEQVFIEESELECMLNAYLWFSTVCLSCRV